MNCHDLQEIFDLHSTALQLPAHLSTLATTMSVHLKFTTPIPGMCHGKLLDLHNEEICIRNYYTRESNSIQALYESTFAKISSNVKERIKRKSES